MKARGILTFFILALAVRAAEIVSTADHVFGKTVTLKSAAMNENRRLRIYVPPNYESARDSYPTLPVLYLLDGQNHFVHGAGLVDREARTFRIPLMIVVAIEQVDRTRELTPTRSDLDVSGKPADNYETSGGAEKFLTFVRDEVIPYVDANYRTAPFRVLVGHSFGGLFAVKVLLEQPDLFQGHILISPALWWDQQVVLKNTGPIGRPKQFIFVTVGNEGGAYRPTIDRFLGQLKERAAPGLAWSFKTYDDEWHSSVVHPALYDGLRFVFAGWDILKRSLDAEPTTLAALIEHYQQLSARYGYSIPVPLAHFSDVGDGYMRKEKWDEAITAYQEAIRRFPRSAASFEGLGRAQEKKGDKAAARKAYETTLTLDSQNQGANKGIKRLAAPDNAGK